MTDASQQASQAIAISRAVSRVLEESSLATLATLIESPHRQPGAKLLVEETGTRTGTLGDAGLDDAVTLCAQAFLSSRAEATTLNVESFAPALEAWRGTRIMFERVEPEPRLVICGAGHVGAALARLARITGYQTTLIDDRADFLTRERFPDEDLELVVAESWVDAVREAVGRGHGVSVAVVTRGHNEDEECMRAVVQAHPDYMGLIGSKRRTNIVLERLKEAGVDALLLREVHAPIGLDIGAVSPEEVALSILAEIVAGRRGGSGAPLSEWRRKSEIDKEKEES